MSTKTKTIVRVSKRENPYVTLDKFFFSDERLSWKAKGLLGYLLSKPDDWTIYIADLVKRAKDGRDSIYAGLKELELVGYLKRDRKHNEQGQFAGYEYVIYERPQEVENKEAIEQPDIKKVERLLPDTKNLDEPHQGKPYTEKPYSDKPYTGKPYLENPTLLNNDLTNNDLTNKRQQQGTQDEKTLNHHKSVVVLDSGNQGGEEVLTAFWQIAVKRKTDKKFINKLLIQYSEQEILEEIRKINETYTDKSAIREPKALLVSALRTKFDNPEKGRENLLNQTVNLRKMINEISKKKFGLSFAEKLKVVTEEMGYSFSQTAIETVEKEYLARDDKYKDVYQN